MKYFLSALILAAACGLAAAQDAPPGPAVSAPGTDVRLDLDALPLSQVVNLAFKHITPVSYVLSPEVVSDQRLVSVRWSGPMFGIREFMGGWLDSLGYAITEKTGTLFIAKKPEVKELAPTKEETDTIVYYPRYQSATALRELAQGLFAQAGTAGFAARRGVASKDATPSDTPAPHGSAAALVDKEDRALTFTGTAADRKKLLSFLEQIDQASPVVNVHGAIFEVATSKTTGSAFKLAASILGGRFGVSIGSATPGAAITVNAGGIQAAISALNTDSRFRVLSNPNLLVRSGASARLTVGQEVPTAGAVTVNQSGGVQRSVEYKPSGVIFDLQPHVYRDTVRLKIGQTVSQFVKTETGQNDSPTLLKREAKTDVDVKPGQVVVIGGLLDAKQTHTTNRLAFLPDWTASTTEDGQQNELLVFLQVDEFKN